MGVVTVDGSKLEGGGQILRNSLTLSCLLQQPIKVNNIRAGRDNPGLRPQHLTGLYLLADVSTASLNECEIGSTEIAFHPENIRGGDYVADTKTAGSVCLLIQSVLPCLLFTSKPSVITLKGGTNCEMAPQIDYFSLVWPFYADLLGFNFECKINKRGFYPKGGGIVELCVNPVDHLKPINLLSRGTVQHIIGVAFVSGTLPLKIVHSALRSAKGRLYQHFPDVPVDIDIIHDSANQNNATGLLLVAVTNDGCRISGGAIGKRGLPGGKMGELAADQLIENLSHEGVVDEFMQDQTKFQIETTEKGCILRCNGIGLQNEHLSSKKKGDGSNEVTPRQVVESKHSERTSVPYKANESEITCTGDDTSQAKNSTEYDVSQWTEGDSSFWD